MNTLGLDQRADRCAHGFAAIQHPQCCACKVGVTSEWSVFLAALRSAGHDGLVHQRDVRPLIRGRIEPKHIGTLYRRAKAEGLLVDTGDREPSDDTAGRNADKLDRIYELRAA